MEEVFAEVVDDAVGDLDQDECDSLMFFGGPEGLKNIMLSGGDDSPFATPELDNPIITENGYTSEEASEWAQGKGQEYLVDVAVDRMFANCLFSDNDQTASNATTTTNPPAANSQSPTTTEKATTTTTDSAGSDPGSALPLVGGTFWWEQNGDRWEGQLDALVDAPVSEFFDEPGRCLILVGSLTPTDIDEGAISNPFSAPDMLLVVNGQLIDEFGSCDTSGVEAAGYQERYDAKVTAGTEFSFYKELFIPGEEPGVPEAVSIGSTFGGESIYYTADIATQIPTAR